MYPTIKLSTTIEDEFIWLKRERSNIKEAYLKKALWKEIFCYDTSSKKKKLSKDYFKLHEAGIPIHSKITSYQSK